MAWVSAGCGAPLGSPARQRGVGLADGALVAGGMLLLPPAVVAPWQWAVEGRAMTAGRWCGVSGVAGAALGEAGSDAQRARRGPGPCDASTGQAGGAGLSGGRAGDGVARGPA